MAEEKENIASKDSTNDANKEGSSATPAQGEQVSTPSTSSKESAAAQTTTKKASGTFETLKVKQTDTKSVENNRVNSQPESANKVPVSDRTARTADQISQAYLDKHFKDYKNESNLTLETSLTVYTYEKSKGANETSQRTLGDVLEKALREKYNKVGFKNDERAKSVIALLLSSTEIGGLKEITPSAKNRVVQAILGVHTNLIPKVVK